MANSKPETRGVPPPEAKAPMEKPQRERFIEAAREAGVQDDTLDKALEKLTPPKRK